MITVSSNSRVSAVETRVVVVGVAESGKSSLVGSLTSGLLDNGSGLSRMLVFRHRHELVDGRTSSVGHQLIGFGREGNVLTIPPHALKNSICMDTTRSVSPKMNFGKKKKKTAIIMRSLFFCSSSTSS